MVVKYPGSAQDSRIFRESHIGQELQRGDRAGVTIIGDAGYGLQTYLLVPIRQPLTAGERRYNAAHKRTRVRIEQSFGILKRKFAILQTGVRMVPERAAVVITACFILCNIANAFYGAEWNVEEDNYPVSDDDEDVDNNNNVALPDNRTRRERQVAEAHLSRYVRLHFG